MVAIEQGCWAERPRVGGRALRSPRVGESPCRCRREQSIRFPLLNATGGATYSSLKTNSLAACFSLTSSLYLGFTRP